ncbi:hypothetical protein ACT3SZ_06495 [Corynebacterium sp. AOP40-9SA-29]|uniref:hypothetical protein n=1 Tax=Corynebacterium sp. AOP40-9SA-29 TaxID=3457677 RepID=UPI00403400F5
MSRLFALAVRAMCSGWVVIGLIGLSTAMRGFFYLPAVVRDSDRLPTVEEYAPLWVWAAIWIGGGTIATILALTRRWLSLGVGLIVGLPVMWAVLHIGAWLTGESRAGYVTALTYAVAALSITAYYVLLSQRGGGEQPSTSTET